VNKRGRRSAIAFLDIGNQPAYSERVRINPFSGMMFKKSTAIGAVRPFCGKRNFGCAAPFLLCPKGGETDRKSKGKQKSNKKRGGARDTLSLQMAGEPCRICYEYWNCVEPRFEHAGPALRNDEIVYDSEEAMVMNYLVEFAA